MHDDSSHEVQVMLVHDLHLPNPNHGWMSRPWQVGWALRCGPFRVFSEMQADDPVGVAWLPPPMLATAATMTPVPIVEPPDEGGGPPPWLWLLLLLLPVAGLAVGVVEYVRRRKRSQWPR